MIGLGGSAMVELAMASYLSLYPALLLPPTLLLCQKRQPNVLRPPKFTYTRPQF